MKFVTHLLISLSLSACAESQQNLETLPVATKVNAAIKPEKTKEQQPQTKTEEIIEGLKGLVREYYEGEREEYWISTFKA